MSQIKTGLFKSHPKSMFVKYVDIVRNPDTLNDELIVWENYTYHINTDGRKAGGIAERNRIPVIILQIMEIRNSVLAEVVKVEDYSNETLF